MPTSLTVSALLTKFEVFMTATATPAAYGLPPLDGSHAITVDSSTAGTLQRPSVGNWGYIPPGIAAAGWFIIVIAGIAYGGYAGHNYQYPNNQVNPALFDDCIKAMKGGAYTIAASFPIATVATGALAVYTGASNVCNGIKATCLTAGSAIWDSLNPRKLGDPEAMMINTVVSAVAAPFAIVAACCYGLGNARSY